MREEPDYKHLFESAPGLFLVLDPDLHIIAASDAYCQSTLTRRDEILGRRLFDVFPDNPDDPSADAIRNTRASLNRVLQSRQTDVMVIQRHDVRRPESEGGAFEVRYWSPINSPVLNPDGSLAYIIHRVENVTDFVLLKERGFEQVKLTDELRERAVQMQADLYSRSREVADASLKLKQANEELARLNEKARELDQLKNTFFAHVSHELRTPLTLILGPVDRQMGRTDMDEPMRRDLQVVQRNARLLLKHVNDLLDIARLDAGRMHMHFARTDLVALARRVASCFEVLAADRNLHYVVHTPVAISGEVDGEKVERVLFNLLSNAFKFTPQGGTVSLTLEERAGRAGFIVQDNGPGIPEGLREAVFERFRQGQDGTERPHDGTGLGLAIVREFVALHQGSVCVSEAPGGGARFRVDMPLAAPPGVQVAETAPVSDDASAVFVPAEPRRDPSASASREADGDAARVLIIEDNPEMNDFLARMLSPHYRVSRAFDGLEGLEKALEDPPDLIIADIMMPKMSGDRMVEQMRRHRKLDDVQVVMLTAKADDDLRIKLLRQGIQDFINKPFSAAELIARVDGLLAQRRRSEKRLQQSESKYRTLFESIDEGFCLIEVIFDERDKPVDYRFLEFNPAFEQQTGLIDALGRTMRELVPKQEQHWFDIYGRVARTGQPIRFENHAAQLHRWYDVYAWRFGDPYSSQVAVLFKDITERKIAEEELLESERRLRLSLESAYVISFEWDIASGQVFRLTSRDPALPPTWFAAGSFEQVVNVIHPDDRARFQANLKAAMERTDGRYENEFRIVHPDGQIRYLHENGYFEYDTSGRPSRLIGLSQDITSRKDAENALRKSEERFELLAHVAERLLRSDNPQAIVEDLCRLVMQHIDCQFFFNYLVDVPGKQMYLNACAGIPEKTAESIRRLDFGVAVCGCVARDCQRIIAEDIQHSEDIRTQLVKSFGVQAYCCHPLMMQDRLIGTLSFGTKTRPTFTADEVALMKSVSGQVAVAMQRLISKRELSQLNEALEQRVVERTRLAEDRAIQLRSLAVEMIEVEERERRRFADLLHEDLQQMLASARFQLQAVSADKSADPAVEHVSRILEESIGKARRLTHELSPPVMHHGDLSSAMKWLSDQMNEHFGFSVDLETQNIPELKNSPVKVFVFRAVQELLFNIVKHAGVKSARVLLSCKNNHLDVTVSDHGKGFDKGDLDRGKIKIGFGLISIRERARHIRGDLKIESEHGCGSLTRLTVPIQHAAGESVPLTPEAPFNVVAQKISSQGAGPRVLFVDDHKVMRQALIRLISSQPNIQVAGEAASGKEAVELALQLHPDVILMDISMSEMDGIEATKRIKAELPDVRVIGLSM
jgi:PAS domain S-box-containing protein